LRNFDTPISIDLPLSNAEVSLPDPNQVLPPPATQDPNDPNNPYLLPNDTEYERLNVYWFAECGDLAAMGRAVRTPAISAGSQRSDCTLQRDWAKHLEHPDS